MPLVIENPAPRWASPPLGLYFMVKSVLLAGLRAGTPKVPWVWQCLLCAPQAFPSQPSVGGDGSASTGIFGPGQGCLSESSVAIRHLPESTKEAESPEANEIIQEAAVSPRSRLATN